MGGTRLVTKGDSTPHALSDLKGVRNAWGRSFTIRRDPTDTSGGIVYVGPDKGACVIPLQAGDWYWEKDLDQLVDMGQLALNDNGVSGAKVSFAWVNSPPPA